MKRPAAILLLVLLFPALAASQPPAPAPGPNPALRTPLPQAVLDLLANELSGQMIFNNEVLLAGAPRLRESSEFKTTFYEAQKIWELARGYGIETARLVKHPSTRTFDYPTEGEFWVMEPEKRLVARLGADAALVASGSSTADITGELVYIPPMPVEALQKALDAAPGKYRGALALMWSHAREDAAKVLDGAGLAGVVSFSSRDRYFDPNQVVYGGGSYKNAHLKIGLNVSWRQWSELFEEVQLAAGAGRKIVVRARAKVETFPDRFEAVFSQIPGTEPGAKGVIFTAHLFEGFVKRGANDDMSGCVVQLEILRALQKLIVEGALPRPRRTISFLWPNEISGTYEFIKQNPGIADTWSININMDMVGEALRRNNALFTMSETPDHLPSYIDGLSKSILNYVWRTNDIVYLPDSPRGRPGGQYFPKPMVEKNGSTDAFRFYIHRATGGSDHICFNNPVVGVPGIEFFVWPDQWYHADTDTPDKSDPTEMKRVAFIGAAAAWAAANCTDDVVTGLVDATSEFGYTRVAGRDLPRALAWVEAAEPAAIGTALARALSAVDFAVDREVGALGSIGEIHSGSPKARTAVAQRVQQWELYRAGLKAQMTGYARVKGHVPPRAATRKPTALESRARELVPAFDPAVKGQQFALAAFPAWTTHLKEHPGALKALKLTPQLANGILNYVNGKRTAATIRDYVSAETGQEVPLESVVGYLDLLTQVRWLK